MKCIGVFKNTNYRLYYDAKHDEYLLMTPNFRFTRMMGHCNNDEVRDWAYDLIEKHKAKYLECLLELIKEEASRNIESMLPEIQWHCDLLPKSLIQCSSSVPRVFNKDQGDYL